MEVLVIATLVLAALIACILAFCLGRLIASFLARRCTHPGLVKTLSLVGLMVSAPMLYFAIGHDLMTPVVQTSFDAIFDSYPSGFAFGAILYLFAVLLTILLAGAIVGAGSGYFVSLVAKEWRKP